MSEKILPYAGADTWKSLGRMGRTAASAAASGQNGLVDQMDAVNRPGVYDNDHYDGGAGSPMGDRPFQSYDWFGRHDQTLGNPYGNRDMDDHTSGQSQLYHFRDILNQPGEKRLNLVKAAARAKNKLVRNAREQGHADNAYTVVANTDSQAKVIWAMLEAVSEQFPVDTRESQRPVKVLSHDEESAEKTIERNKDLQTSREGKQVLPKSDKDVDWAKLEKSFTEKADLSPMRPITLSGKTGKYAIQPASNEGDKVKGVIAVVASKGMEAQALKAIKAVSKDYAVAPSKNLYDQLSKTKVNARLVKLYEDKSQSGRAIKDTLSASHTAVYFVDNNYKTAAYKSMGEAAAQGKLSKVFTHEGQADLMTTRKEALQGYSTGREIMQAKAREAFNIPADAPHARLGLSLISDEKEGPLSTKDVESIAAIGRKKALSINDVVDMATTEEGRNELLRDKVSAAGLRLLSKPKALSDAASKLTHIRVTMSKHNVGILTGDDLPKELQGNVPYLFFQGDPSMLKDGKKIVGLVGDDIPNRKENESERAIIASRASPLATSLAKQDSIRRMTVEGQLPFEDEAQPGDIKILTSGHAIVKSAQHAAEREADVAKGVLLLSTQPPVGVEFYNAKTKETEVAHATENEHTQNAAARLLGKFADELVVTNFDKGSRLSPSREAVKSFAERENRPIVTDFTDLKHMRNTSGNNALVSARGTKAFQAAGFGDASAQALGAVFDQHKARPGVSTGPHFALAGEKIAAKANKQNFSPIVKEKPAEKTKEDVLY